MWRFGSADILEDMDCDLIGMEYRHRLELKLLVVRLLVVARA